MEINIVCFYDHKKRILYSWKNIHLPSIIQWSKKLISLSIFEHRFYHQESILGDYLEIGPYIRVYKLFFYIVDIINNLIYDVI